MSKNYNSFPCSYLQNGRLNDATADMEKIIEINPKVSAAHHRLGAIYQKQGHFDEAIAEYKRALEISPDLKEALIGLEDTYRLKEKKTKNQGSRGIRKR
ncbi:MAG TPA: tetratricopeptide repeat protein [Candidatus Wunengus californicus]|uniref:tetratricopeptide repeat protein n=1 Tax=Candidatus Wunengus californicus TaxID=3367619 RepID=UPI0040289329